METRINRGLNLASLFSLGVVWLSVIPICTGQVIYSPSPCDISCEEITDPLCHFATYTYTGFPNLLGHTKQGYIQQYDHLIELLQNCYDHSMDFLCGILTPHCVANQGLMLPTKKTCEEFHEACDEFLEEAGTFLLDCNILPEEINAPPVCIHFPTKAPDQLHGLVTQKPVTKAPNCISGVSSIKYSSALLIVTYASFFLRLMF